jgi:hypothetical protein
MSGAKILLEQIGNMVPVNPGFKYLKKIGLKGRQSISLPGASTCLDPALYLEV